MGANTYIGNATELYGSIHRRGKQNQDAQLFWLYGLSLAFLIPLFILNTLIFFR